MVRFVTKLSKECQMNVAGVFARSERWRGAAIAHTPARPMSLKELYCVQGWAPCMQKILVVEDGKAVQRALKRLFASEGFSVEIVANGEQGLTEMKRMKPDLVMLDLGLPGLPGVRCAGR